MTPFGIMVSICNISNRLNMHTSIALDPHELIPPTYIEEFAAKYIHVHTKADGFLFVGFVSKSKYLNTEEDLIFNILSIISPSDISIIIIEYMGLRNCRRLKLKTLHIDNNLYLHYMINIKKELAISVYCKEYYCNPLKFDNDVINYYLLDVWFHKPPVDRYKRQDYTKYYVNYINTITKTNKVTLDLANQSQKIPIIEGNEVNERGKRYFNIKKEDILLQFQMPIIEYIKYIEFQIHGISKKYDILYMKYIDKIICPWAKENSLSISFTNGYFGYFNLEYVVDLSLIIHYNKKMDKKIKTHFEFMVCTDVQ